MQNQSKQVTSLEYSKGKGKGVKSHLNVTDAFLNISYLIKWIFNWIILFFKEEHGKGREISKLFPG